MRDVRMTIRKSTKEKVEEVAERVGGEGKIK